MSRTEVARNAVAMALRVRQRAGLGLTSPANPFDACATLNVEVKFSHIPSLEGMLARRPRLTVIVSSARPSGRQAFTCAHELGHLVLDHQSTVDDVRDLMADSDLGFLQDDLDEYAADQFAAFFLMPKTAVISAMRDRLINPETCPATSLLVLASWFGVGFTTLVGHLRFGLNSISQGRFQALRRLRPRALRKELTGEDLPGLVMVDHWWTRPTVDVRCGDAAWFPAGKVTSDMTSTSAAHGGTLLVAERPGIFVAASPTTGTLQVRCMKRDFEGRSIYRHLAADEDDVSST